MRDRITLRAVTLTLITSAACTLGGVGTGCAELPSTSESSRADLAAVENTEVKSQPIGNCWLYSAAGWAESLYKGATGQSIDLSESYWSYWYWYEQVVADPTAILKLDKTGRITEGGWWGGAAELIRRYGWMREADFVGPGQDENVAVKAVAYMNDSLQKGILSDPAARKDSKVVRAELNKAWNLPPVTVAALNVAFPAGAPLVEDEADAGPLPTDPSTLVHPASDLPALSSNGWSATTLMEVVGMAAEGTRYWQGIRVGDEAWSTVRYTWSDASSSRRRAILKNVQNTLHRRLGVPLSWAPATGAKDGRYRTEIAVESRTNGLHASLLVDYEATNVPGFGTLPVGTPEVRPQALEAALSDETTISFFRIKNSWGSSEFWTKEELKQMGAKETDPAKYGPKGTYLPSMPGFNDIELGYVDAIETKFKENGGHYAKDVTLPPNLRFAIPNE